MTSKYEMAARARKKKRKVSQLGKSYGKSKSKGLSAMKSAMKKPQPGLAAAAKAAKLKKSKKLHAKRKLTPAEQRRMKILEAKATTAKRKLAVQKMDKKIAKIKKGK